jgi:hypothetical protein
MAATYVKITREEFEDWLFDLCPVFERVEDTEGIYLVPISPYVAIKISTTMRAKGTTTPRGDGRCRMRLISRHRGTSLHGPESDVITANRTKGWRENWRENLKSLSGLFKAHKKRYHELATRSQTEYASEWKTRIEGIKGWGTLTILADLHRVLGTGMWLTPRQEAAVWKFVRPVRGRSRSTTTTPVINKADAEILACSLDHLAEEAKEISDEWTVKFAISVAARLRRGQAPTTAQHETIVKKLKKYGIAVPAAA